jgi:hypothetical protein
LLDWGLNSGLQLAKQELSLLRHISSPFCSGKDMGSLKLFLGLAWNLDPPDLSLPTC